ncbi:MAG: CNNM domain-containing protein [bacterium]|nr:CNNM domain-containing protein [bacterium]
MSQLYSWPILSVALIALLILSAFFSGSEAAMMSLNRLRIAYLAKRRQSKKAQLIDQLLEQKKGMLSTILVGNNFANVAASSVATALAIALWGRSGILYATIIITLILLIFCEITPKIYASRFPEKIASVVVHPIAWCMSLLRPAVSAVNLLSDLLLKLVVPSGEGRKMPLISEEEILAAISMGEEEGVVEKEEGKMLMSIFELASISVKEIMIPRTEMICIEEKASYNEVVRLIEQSGRSRIPVYRESIDNIVGTIYSRDLISFQGSPKSFSLAKIMHPPFFIPESKKALSLLAEFKERKMHLALVVDEYGGIEGLVTLEDVLEEIVGDILDEYDRKREWIKYLPDGKILVDGHASIREINRSLNTNIPHEEFQTLSGLILDQLGHIPAKGESVSYGGYLLTVSSMRRQRISKVEIQILDQPKSE